MNETERGELISAMADGQVSAEAFARGLQLLDDDSGARLTWDTYHLIGDVLRSSDLASAVTSTAFTARLRPMLPQEPHQPPGRVLEGEVLPGGAVVRSAANDNSFRWKLVAGVASVTAAAALGWNVIGAGLDRSQGPQLAAAPAQQPVVQTAAQRGVMLRDPRLDELLAAHRQFGSPAALQMPTGAAVQNADFEAPAR